MAVNHMDAVNIKNNNGNNGNNALGTLNQQRIKAIRDIDQDFAAFFLGNLHNLMWKDFATGVQSTIPFDEAYKMLKLATDALYDLLVASVEDKFCRDVSVSEMTSVIAMHNLNNEFTLGKNVKKSKK